MSDEFTKSILFCCDHNAVRSPMAEGIMKKYYGQEAYVQSAGVKGELEIDGFCIAVCEEIGVAIERHQSRSFSEIGEMGDHVSTFDLVIALSPTSREHLVEITGHYHLELEYWPIVDPTGSGEGRMEKLVAYRKTRDQIAAKITEHFGAPK